jgi:tight adherence protein C
MLLVLAVAVATTAILAVAWVGVRLVRQPVSWDRFDEAGDGPAVAAATQQRSLVAGLARRLEDTAVSLAGDRVVERYRHRLQAAGSPDGITARSFLGRKAAYTLVFGIVGVVFLLSGNTFTGVALPVLGFFLQDLWLNRAVRTRQEALERDLPDFLDVLSITVEAGLGFQAALRRVGAAMAGPLGQEIEKVLQQMSLGMPRREAFDLLRRRNDSEILAQFVTALLQAEELGAPLAQALRTMADDLREQWYQKARRDAARAAPRISMIVSFTLVPASMIVILTAILLSSGFSVSQLTGG